MHTVGLDTVVRFVMINNYNINVLECQINAKKYELKPIDQNILQLFQSLDMENFIVLKENKQEVKVFTSNSNGWEYRTLYEETVGKI